MTDHQFNLLLTALEGLAESLEEIKSAIKENTEAVEAVNHAVRVS